MTLDLLKQLYPINFKMLSFQGLEIVINSGVQGISNRWQYVYKKPINSFSEIFSALKESIVSGMLIHHFP